jgi:hypothetical protein
MSGSIERASDPSHLFVGDSDHDLDNDDETYIYFIMKSLHDSGPAERRNSPFEIGLTVSSTLVA